jgi:hypothetical protein
MPSSQAPFALLDLFARREDGAVAHERAAVQISGDAEIAARYRDLIELARPDWEEELSRLIGDLPARRLSLAAQAALSWARGFARTAGANVAEYLQEESRALVSKPEVEEFLANVDELRETADRVEARLAPRARLERGSRAEGRRDAAARRRPAARDPSRAGAPRTRRLRTRHASVSPVSLLVLSVALDVVSAQRRSTRGERLRLALEELGPIFVKFGQAVSTRRDLLPVDIADELAKLQDRVPPFDSKVAVATIEQAFGRPLQDIFATFEETRSRPPRSPRCMARP